MNNDGDDDLPSSNDDTDDDDENDDGDVHVRVSHGPRPFICVAERPSLSNVVHKPGKSTTSGLRSREARGRVRSSDEIRAIRTETERVGESGSGGGEAVALPLHPPKVRLQE